MEKLSDDRPMIVAAARKASSNGSLGLFADGEHARVFDPSLNQNGVELLLGSNSDTNSSKAVHLQHVVLNNAGNSQKSQAADSGDLHHRAVREFTANARSQIQVAEPPLHLSPAEYDHIIFDTAPTGHTLRLLTLPSAWSGFMESNTTGTSCLGPLAGLQAQHKLYQETVRALADPQSTTLVLVTRAEPAALREAARTSSELAALGAANQHLVVNDAVAADTERCGKLSVQRDTDRFVASANWRAQPPTGGQLPLNDEPL